MAVITRASVKSVVRREVEGRGIRVVREEVGRIHDRILLGIIKRSKESRHVFF